MLRRLSWVLSLLVCGWNAVSVEAAPRPNVVFILTDDQRFDTIRALGNPEIETPHLDRLVQRGFSFKNAYCQGGMFPAVCLPSRTMVLTGRSAFRIPDVRTKSYSQAMLGSTFRTAGYATFHCGKRGNSFIPGMESFETVRYSDVNLKETQATQPQVVVDAALDFLQTAPADRPFWLYLAPHYPHDPRVAPQQFHQRYDPAKLSLSKNFLPDHPIDNGALRIRDEELAPHPRTPEVMRQHLADYYACITNLDDQLGRLFAELERSDKLANTLIVFTSDQGLAVGGRHGLMGKQNLYEHFKSPLVIAGPGVPHGESDALVYLYDLFPTLCQATGTPIPADCDGKSLWPVIQGQQERVREALFAVYTKTQRMVRDARWKLMWYPVAGRFQLFDLQSDPDEIHDLSADPQHAETLAKMKQLLREQQDHFGDNQAPRPE